jgi:hypothetical protein
MAFDNNKKLFPVVYKEKIIQNTHIKSVERHMASEVQFLHLVPETNEIIAIGNNKMMIYFIEDNLSTVLQRTCDISLDKLNESIINIASQMKLLINL